MASQTGVESGTCRLCRVPLQQHETERRLCSVCEEYAHQLGVRKDSEFDAAIDEILTFPVFRQSLRQTH
jgi:hypothetical protein